MIRHTLVLTAVCLVAAASLATPARADADDGWGWHRWHHWYRPYAYVPPPVIYVPPPRVYYTPPPAYYAPPPRMHYRYGY